MIFLSDFEDSTEKKTFSSQNIFSQVLNPKNPRIFNPKNNNVIYFGWFIFAFNHLLQIYSWKITVWETKMRWFTRTLSIFRIKQGLFFAWLWCRTQNFKFDFFGNKSSESAAEFPRSAQLEHKCAIKCAS